MQRAVTNAQDEIKEPHAVRVRLIFYVVNWVNQVGVGSGYSSSSCWLMSRPASSSSGVTRNVLIMSVIFNKMNEPKKAKADTPTRVIK